MNYKLINTLACLTIACPNKEDFSNFLLKIFKWEIFHKGKITIDMENMWNISSGTAGKDYIVLRSPGMDRGMIRLVDGVIRKRNKQRSFRWGGFEIVVMYNIDSLYKQLLNNKIVSILSEPENHDFTNVDSNIHRAFHVKFPGGTHGTITMKLSEPKGRKFPISKSQVGHIFEIPLNTDKYTNTKKFYNDVLKMPTILELISKKGSLHKSWNIPEGNLYSLSILKSSGPESGSGSIEIHGCDSSFIDEKINKQKEFDGGASLVTFTTKDILKVYNSVLDSSCASEVTKIISIENAPYKGCKCFSFEGPNKEKIEIVESWS